MRIDVANDRGTTIVCPAAGRLDIEAAAEFRALLLSLIDRGDRRLVIDLEHVTFIDSSGIGTLVSALKALKRTTVAGDLRLARAQPAIVALLETIRLNRVFSSYTTVEGAVASFL